MLIIIPHHAVSISRISFTSKYSLSYRILDATFQGLTSLGAKPKIYVVFNQCLLKLNISLHLESDTCDMWRKTNCSLTACTQLQIPRVKISGLEVFIKDKYGARPTSLLDSFKTDRLYNYASESNILRNFETFIIIIIGTSIVQITLYRSLGGACFQTLYSSRTSE